MSYTVVTAHYGRGLRLCNIYRGEQQHAWWCFLEMCHPVMSVYDTQRTYVDLCASHSADSPQQKAYLLGMCVCVYIGISTVWGQMSVQTLIYLTGWISFCWSFQWMWSCAHQDLHASNISHRPQHLPGINLSTVHTHWACSSMWERERRSMVRVRVLSAEAG